MPPKNYVDAKTCAKPAAQQVSERVESRSITAATIQSYKDSASPRLHEFLKLCNNEDLRAQARKILTNFQTALPYTPFVWALLLAARTGAYLEDRPSWTVLSAPPGAKCCVFFNDSKSCLRRDDFHCSLHRCIMCGDPEHGINGWNLGSVSEPTACPHWRELSKSFRVLLEKFNGQVTAEQLQSLFRLHPDDPPATITIQVVVVSKAPLKGETSRTTEAAEEPEPPCEVPAKLPPVKRTMNVIVASLIARFAVLRNEQLGKQYTHDEIVIPRMPHRGTDPVLIWCKCHMCNVTGAEARHCVFHGVHFSAAADVASERRVVVKVFWEGKCDEGEVCLKQCFENERNQLQKFDDIIDSGVMVEIPNRAPLTFVATPLPLRTLRDLLAALIADKALNFDDQLSLLRLASETVSNFHSHNVVHADVKPANILVSGGKADSQDGAMKTDRFVLKFCDFEFSSLRLLEMDNKRQSVGATDFWACPLQSMSRKGSYRSDSWSLALVLYEIFNFRMLHCESRLHTPSEAMDICAPIMFNDTFSDIPPEQKRATLSQLLNNAYHCFGNRTELLEKVEELIPRDCNKLLRQAILSLCVPENEGGKVCDNRRFNENFLLIPPSALMISVLHIAEAPEVMTALASMDKKAYFVRLSQTVIDRLNTCRWYYDEFGNQEKPLELITASAKVTPDFALRQIRNTVAHPKEMTYEMFVRDLQELFCDVSEVLYRLELRIDHNNGTVVKRVAVSNPSNQQSSKKTGALENGMPAKKYLDVDKTCANPSAQRVPETIAAVTIRCDEPQVKLCSNETSPKAEAAEEPQPACEAPAKLSPVKHQTRPVNAQRLFALPSVSGDMTPVELSDAFSRLMSFVVVAASDHSLTAELSYEVLSEQSKKVACLHKDAGFLKRGYGCCFSCTKDSGVEKYCVSCQKSVAEPCKKLLASIDVRCEDVSEVDTYNQLYNVHLPKLKATKDEPLLNEVATNLSNTIKIFRRHYNGAAEIGSILSATAVALDRAHRTVTLLKLINDLYIAPALPASKRELAATFVHSVLEDVLRRDVSPNDAVDKFAEAIRQVASTLQIAEAALPMPMLVDLTSKVRFSLQAIELVQLSMHLFWLARRAEKPIAASPVITLATSVAATWLHTLAGGAVRNGIMWAIFLVALVALSSFFDLFPPIIQYFGLQ